MFQKFGSIRNLVLLSTLAVAAVGLVLSYFIATIIEQRAQMNAASGDISAIATAAYDDLVSPNAMSQLSLLAGVNPNVGISISKGRSKLFLSLPKTQSGQKLTQSTNVGGYHIVATVNAGNLAPLSAEITAVSGALSALIIVAGLTASSLLTRSLKKPVSEAVQAAEKIASGDFSARITPSGPEEIAKVAIAFDFMARHLEEADETKKRFLSDLAHEIATPLNSISGFALALSDGTITGEQERIEVNEIIASETLRIKCLLYDLGSLDNLDLSYSSREQTINIKNYLQDLTAKFSPQISEKSIAFQVESGRMNIVADRRLLDMVMSNLISNAIRYVGDSGEITLYAKDLPHQDVALGVKDNGIGISPEHLPLIFDRLYRVDYARDRTSGGSGLGLSIAQRAALNLGGKIEVSSELGLGSDFRLVFAKNEPPKRAANLLKTIKAEST